MEASKYWLKKYIANTVGAFPFLISLFVTCNQDFYLGILLDVTMILNSNHLKTNENNWQLPHLSEYFCSNWPNLDEICKLCIPAAAVWRLPIPKAPAPTEGDAQTLKHLFEQHLRLPTQSQSMKHSSTSDTHSWGGARNGHVPFLSSPVNIG